MARRLAAADIGSNTVHLLVASVGSGRVRRIRNDSDWIGLGESVSREGRISEFTQGTLISSLLNFQAISASHKAEALYVLATEAVRSASNGEAVLAEIQRRTGLEVQVISGEREAVLGLRGALIDTRPAEHFAFAEVGGGSAQLASCDGRQVTDEMSLPIGTGRLTAMFSLEFPCRPPSLAKVESYVADIVSTFSPTFKPTKLIASGGVARGLVRALHPDGDRRIHLSELEYLVWATQRLTVEQTSQRFGVKLKRASTLMLGSVIFRQVLDHLSLNEVQVSEFGVREGALLEIAEGGLILPGLAKVG
ncbi:MAG TPA: hypothetical protein PKA27_03070 [Fimbriimonadaceae bacterium]|nr:hypothetical protein [Fimbriimonadaceae bacterium]